MKDNRLIIRINKPASSVFDFTIEPNNTPKWIDSIVSEEVSETPIKVGTRYSNTDKSGVKNTYEVSEFVSGERFEFKSVPPGYTVRYTFTPFSLTETQLEYHEWVDEGELPAPFDQANLDKLKVVLE